MTCFRLLIAFTIAPILAHAQTGWIEVRSEHFAVYTDTTLEKATAVAEDFETRRSTFSEALVPVGARTLPIRVVLLDESQDFLDWLPEPLRDRRKTAYLIAGPGGTFVLARDDAPESLWEDVGHSMGHLLLSRSVLWQPFWLQEGVAEYMRQLGGGRDDEALTREDGFSVAEILTIVPSMNYDDLEEGGVFRRQAYRLLRVLMDAYPQELGAYLNSLQREAGIDSTPHIAPEILEERLFSYQETSLPFSPVPIEVAHQMVPPAELNVVFGDLAFAMGLPNKSRDYYSASSAEGARVGLAVLAKGQPASHRTFVQLVEDFPASGISLYHMGTLESETGSDLSGRIHALELAVDLLPLSGRARAALGRLYAMDGRPGDAIPLLEEAVEKEPELADGFYEILADVHMRLGDYQRATECIEIAALLPHSDPTSLEHYDRLVPEFYRRMAAHRRSQESGRLEELRREVEALADVVDPRPTPTVEEPAPIGRVAYSISSEPSPNLTGPDVTESPMPAYTAEMRRRGLEGRVVLAIELDRRGRIADISVQASDDGELAQASLDAVRRWRFEPARRGFESTAYSFRLIVNFYIE